VTTCFIFAQYLDDEQCLCLRLDQQGQVDAALAMRPIHEVRVLQIDARTIVVVPAQSSSLHKVELPWLGERKARAAIPYALEEQLAQNVTTLHFAFDRKYYKNNCYLVVVTDKQFLVDLIAKLDALDLNFEMITLDWFALKDNEACITEDGLLVRDNVFEGALNGELAAIYLNNKEKNTQILKFKDSISSLKVKKPTSIDSPTSLWVSQRLHQSDGMNLCQADLRHDTRQNLVWHWYLGCAIVASALLVSVMLINAFYLHALTTRISDVDKKTAVLYRDFFPEAKQVISPRFRIGQLLTSGSSNSDTSVLWSLLDKLARGVKQGAFVIEQIRFQNRMLSVTLVSNDFAALENLQQRLQQDKVKVRQAQASSQEHKVVATLELSL
jgi:general secretion pathway protein L